MPEEAYVHGIRRFIIFHNKVHRSTIGAPEVSAFLDLAGGAAILSLYRKVLQIDSGLVEHVPRAVAPARVPVVLSVDEVRMVLAHLDGVSRIVASLLYGAGLRLQECLERRVKDIDFERSEIVVRRGKGQKDRRTITGIWRRDWDASSFRRHSMESIRMPRASGGGSSSSLPPAFVVIRDSGRRPGITCTNPWSSGRWRRPAA